MFFDKERLYYMNVDNLFIELLILEWCKNVYILYLGILVEKLEEIVQWFK